MSDVGRCAKRSGVLPEPPAFLGLRSVVVRIFSTICTVASGRACSVGTCQYTSSTENLPRFLLVRRAGWRVHNSAAQAPDGT